MIVPDSDLRELLIRLAAGDRSVNVDTLVNSVPRAWLPWAKNKRIDRDDVLQVARIAVFEAAHNYDPSRPARGFLSTVIRRKLQNDYERDAHQRRVPLTGEVGVEADNLRCRRIRPCEQTAEADALERIKLDYALIFTPFQTQCLVAFSEGHTYKEIAHRTGRPLKSVANAIFRARKRFDPSSNP